MGILSVLKCLMVFLNGLVFLGGICLISLGTWQIVDPSGIQSLISNQYLEAGSYIIVFVGAVLTFMGYLGCYGVIADNPCMLCFFCVILLMLLMVEVAVIALIQLQGKKKFQDDFIWQYVKKNYQGDNSSDTFSRAWNTFMITFECCGISGPDDFKTCFFFLENQPNDAWPQACCTRSSPYKDAKILNLELCRKGDTKFLNKQLTCPILYWNFIYQSQVPNPRQLKRPRLVHGKYVA